jgi:hypothetical protein
MAQINAGRVVLGGLVAGLVINVGEWAGSMLFFESEMQRLLDALELPEMGGAALAIFLLLGFLGGIVLVWIYAGIRPRFGPGPKTAAMAGVMVWVFAYLWPVVGFAGMGVFDWGTSGIALVWGLVEIPLAAIAGAWLYQEQ